MLICNPNAPSGSLTPPAIIAELASGFDGVVVVDEAYADFAGETLLPDAPVRKRLLVVRTASKAYGLAGLRCGYGVASPDVALEVEKSRGPYKVSTLAAEAAAAAVLDRSGWMAGCVRECVEQRVRFRDELERRGHRTLDSDANFLLLAAPTGAARPRAGSC